MDILGPGEYKVRRTSPDVHWGCISFAKGLFAKCHVVKSFDAAKVLANIALASGTAGWDALHVGHQLVAVDGQPTDHLSSSQLALRTLDATELTLKDEKLGQLELRLMHGVRGAVHFMSAAELTDRMDQAVSCMLRNHLDQAYAHLAEIPLGADVMVSVFKAELQFLRALVSQDELCTQKAVDDAERAVEIAAQFAELPQCSVASKLLHDAALAEALALAGIAHLLRTSVNPAVAALRRSLCLYGALHAALPSPALPTAVQSELLGRARLGLGVFHLFGAVVPGEYQWVLQLLQLRVDIPAGMQLLYDAWTQPHHRAHWAGLALMNASPALLHHRLRAKVTPPPSSSTSDESSEDETDWHDVRVQRRALEQVAARCLAAQPNWVLYLWSASVAKQWTEPATALALALRAEAAVGVAERTYQLQLHVARLSFRALDIPRATAYCQRLITAHARTPAMAPRATRLDACVHLAACLALDGPETARTVRSLLRHALFLRSEAQDDDVALLVDRATYYAEAPDARLALLPFDLLYLGSERPKPPEALALFRRVCRAQIGAWAPPPMPFPHDQPSCWTADDADVATERDAHMRLDAWTLFGLLLLPDPATHNDALWYLAGAVALRQKWPSIASPCVPAACFLLAKELVHVALDAALAVLNVGVAYSELKGPVAASYQGRMKMLEAVLGRRHSVSHS
ncbi:hypothetical protein ACHHYP_01706 [Achlya hypogyna]|uniref:Uncharacterized protein n=1 Tax=Achlya hypogyna TaxID=1202772 RepID=A0A1V9ZT23_ACHHY|nr:hypothetical protein ACHHYP_01706 [Achlya hypogyna]